jgi:cellobiose phosphorylase
MAAGATDEVMPYLTYYSAKRLLGDHVPYPVEAWPEGNQRHLSAESGLYCRVITEGLFGIEPTGFKSFTMTPRLPAGWNFMKLKHIRAFQSDFNLEVFRKGKNARVVVTQSGKIVFDKNWDQLSKISITLNE